MADDSVVGTGLTLTVAGSSPAGEVIDGSFPEVFVGAIDTTTHDTTGHRAYKATKLKDTQEASVTLKLTSTEYDALFDLIGTEDQTITFVHPDVGTLSFTGFILGVSASLPLEDRCSCVVRIKATALPTFVAASY